MSGRLSSSLRNAGLAIIHTESLAVKNREAGGSEGLPDVAGIE